MRVLLFSIIAICIAGSRTQEIAIGTDHLRANFNTSVSPVPAINAQSVLLPGGGFIAVDIGSPTTSTASSTTTLVKNTPTDDDDDDSPEKDTSTNAKPQSFDHEHDSHHQHDASITVDVHNIVDIYKQLLHETEEHILAAIKNSQPSSPAPVLKSYRTADR